MVSFEDVNKKQVDSISERKVKFNLQVSTLAFQQSILIQVNKNVDNVFDKITANKMQSSNRRRVPYLRKDSTLQDYRSTIGIKRE
jgi:hypothetical protein